MLHYQNALEQQPDSSLLHFRVGEILFHGNNYQEAALEFAKALTGDLQPRWTVVFSHIALGRIFDVTGQPERAAGEYQRAIRTGDNSQNAISYAHSYPENPLASSDHDLPSVSTKFDSFPPLPAVVDLFVEAKGEAGIAEWEGVVLLEAAGRQEATQEVWKVLLSSGLDTDSLAMEAAEQWRASTGNSTPARLAVHFVPRAKTSRWHLVSAAFSQSAASSRPRFLSTNYAQGAGVSRSIAETARIAAAVNRTLSVKLQFDIDALGAPTEILILDAPSPQWGYDAAAFVQDWRFMPAIENGAPISARCTIELVWATQEALRNYLSELAGANGRRRSQTPSVAVRP